MMFSFIPWWVVLIWAVFATGFYMIRYRKVEKLRSPWLLGGIFAMNLFFFAWSVIIFVGLELVRSKNKD